MWMVGTSMLLFAIATMFMRNQVRPIRRLSAAVDNFGKGRDVPNFKPEGATEIRLAAAAFERMQGRINNALTQRTEMLAGVSHDLRTPLTRMKLQLALLEESPKVEDLKQDLREMEIMVEEFLAFARGEGTEEVSDCDLVELLGTIVRSAITPHREITLETAGDLRILVRPNAIRRCITSLLVNACTHADHVHVSAERRGTLVEICIDDDAPGSRKPNGRTSSSHSTGSTRHAIRRPEGPALGSQSHAISPAAAVTSSWRVRQWVAFARKSGCRSRTHAMIRTDAHRSPPAGRYSQERPRLHRRGSPAPAIRT